MNVLLPVSKGQVYERDVATLKKYRDDYYRIVLHRTLRRAGYEAIDSDNGDGNDKDDNTGKKNTAGNAEKLDSSLSRTKSIIFQLAMCNPWENFVTMTINNEYHDRKDLNSFKKKLSKWLHNYNRLNNTQIKYLLIPELHKDGINWHLHGLLMGLPIERLTEFKETDKLPFKILIKLAQGRKLYNWEKYAETFGFITIEPIINPTAVSKYITKYITKDMLKTKIDLNNHMYYCSLGLKRAEVLYKDHLTKELENPDYENEWVKIKNTRTFDEAIKYFTDDE